MDTTTLIRAFISQCEADLARARADLKLLAEMELMYGGYAPAFESVAEATRAAADELARNRDIFTSRDVVDEVRRLMGGHLKRGAIYGHLMDHVFKSGTILIVSRGAGRSPSVMRASPTPPDETKAANLASTYGERTA